MRTRRVGARAGRVLPLAEPRTGLRHARSMIDVMCAICGQGVDDSEPDPCALIVVSRWRGPEAQQREQQFFAHAGCLSTVLHPDALGQAEVLNPQSDLYRE